MVTVSALLLQVFAAGVVIIGVLIGWCAAAFIGRKEMDASRSVLDSTRDQLEQVREDFAKFRSLRPFQVQQHLLNIIQSLADQQRSIEAEMRKLGAMRADREARINELSANLDVEHVAIAELEERKRAIRDYEHNLRKLIDRSQSENHIFFESGEAGLRAAEEERHMIGKRIAEHAEVVGSTRGAMNELEREVNSTNVELNRLHETYQLLENRKERLHAAVDAALDGEAAHLESSSKPLKSSDLRRTA